jgi:hypothetical protein
MSIVHIYLQSPPSPETGKYSSCEDGEAYQWGGGGGVGHYPCLLCLALSSINSSAPVLPQLPATRYSTRILPTAIYNAK